MKTSILSGREFERNERTRDVCVVNQSAAAALFPRQSAIGRYVQTFDQLRGRGPGAAPTPRDDAGDVPRHWHRDRREVREPARAAAADDLLSGQRRHRRPQSGVPDQRADEERGDFRLSRGAARDRAVDPAGAVRDVERADGRAARGPAWRSPC